MAQPDKEMGLDSSGNPFDEEKVGEPSSHGSSTQAPPAKHAQRGNSAQRQAEHEHDGESSSESEAEELGFRDRLMGRKKHKSHYPLLPPPESGKRTDLDIFQSLVGIKFLKPGGVELHDHDKGPRPVSPMQDIFMPSKAAAGRFRNRGLYNRALSQDMKNRVMYTMSNYIITILYLLQILVAAALTGLSAYQRSSNVVLTVLGAINTVLAGVLAWLNGQGMPIRFRRARDQYRELVKAIEASERMFSEIDYIKWEPGNRPNPISERDRLEALYEEARQDQEMNYPDVQEGPGKNELQAQGREMQEKIEKQKKKKDKAAGKFKKLKEDHEKSVEGMAVKLDRKVRDAEDAAARRVSQVAQDQEQRFKDALQERSAQLKKVEEEKSLYLSKLMDKPIGDVLGAGDRKEE